MCALTKTICATSRTAACRRGEKRLRCCRKNRLSLSPLFGTIAHKHAKAHQGGRFARAKSFRHKGTSMNSLDQTFLDKVFPTERTDAFFDALFGGAEEGAYDIRLVCRHVSPREARLDFELRQRPGKCLACNLTWPAPGLCAPPGAQCGRDCQGSGRKTRLGSRQNHLAARPHGRANPGGAPPSAISGAGVN